MRIYLGSPITLAMDLQLYTGAGSTGQTPTVALRRVTDGYYLDFADNTFKASGWTTRLKPLTEVSATNAPGVYQYVLATSSIITAEGDYIAEYSNTGTPAGICAETYTFVATVATGVQAGLTAQGYTTTRAGYLDTLNGIVAAIATAVWGAAARTLTAFGFTVATDSDANVTAIKAKTDNLPSDPASVTAVNTRLAASAYTSPDNADISAIKAKTDNLPATPADEGLLLAAISTRLAAADYTAPDNAGIAAIEARTNRIPDVPAAKGDAMALTAAYDAAKTAASQTSVDDLPTLEEIEGSAVLAKEASITILRALSWENVAISSFTYSAGKCTGCTAVLKDVEGNVVKTQTMAATYDELGNLTGFTEV